MKLPPNLGLMLLGIWFVLYGLLWFLHVDFKALPIVMRSLALAAGVLILMKR